MTPLLFNPAAGSGLGKSQAQKAEKLFAKAGIEVELVSTTGPMSASVQCINLINSGAKTIFVVGGDGTFGEAVDGVIRSSKQVTLGLLSGGTGNDFLRSFEVHSMQEAVDRIVNDKTSECDVGKVTWPEGSRYFINIFGVGYFSDVVTLVNKRLKWLGKSAYPIGGILKLFSLDAPKSRINIDGQHYTEELSLLSVCNTKYTGGAMMMAPKAVSDSGEFEIVGLRKTSRPTLIKLLGKVNKGSHLSHPKIFHKTGKYITIECDKKWSFAS